MSDERQNELIEKDATEIMKHSEEKAIGITSTAISLTGVDAILQEAVRAGSGIEVLERLIALKNSEEDRICKKEFDLQFAKMQKNLVPVKKRKDGSKTGDKVAFKYAPIEDCQKPNDPVIAKYGFSYKWTEAEVNGNKRVTILISGHGYTDDSTFFDVPPITGNNLQNDIQVEGVRSGYGKRYTYVGGFGITVEGEDLVDTLKYEDGLMYSEQILTIRECQDIEQLKAVWKSMDIAALSKEGIKVITIERNKRARELE